MGKFNFFRKKTTGHEVLDEASGMRIERLEPRKLFNGATNVVPAVQDFSAPVTAYTFDLNHGTVAALSETPSLLGSSQAKPATASSSAKVLLNSQVKATTDNGKVLISTIKNEPILTGRFVGSVWGDARAAQKDPEASGSLPPAKKNKGLVLVVEDDPASRTALTVILKKRGWDVATAGSLKEGMEKMKTQPDGIIVDLMLPDGDGADLIRQIRSEGLSTRVTVMTGSSDNERLDRVRDLEPDAMLQKPISVAQLLRSLPDTHAPIQAHAHAFAA